MKTLFVCLGNVARSQMAEALFNQLSCSRDAESAGILDFTPAKYVHPIPEVVSVMWEEGIDVSQNLVKTITPQMVNSAESIIILCRQDECPSFLLESGKNTFWPLPDPFGTRLDSYRSIRDRIKKHVKLLISSRKDLRSALE